MKKYVSLGLLSLFCLYPLLWGGCAPSVQNPAPIPYGIWHSDDPDLTLYIDPSVDGIVEYSAVYVLDGKIIECFINIDMYQGGVMDIQTNNDIPDEETEGRGGSLFRGNISEDDKKLHYKVFFLMMTQITKKSFLKKSENIL